MLPALKPGDVFWALQRAPLRRGEIVLIKKSGLSVKRVLGLPCEHVALRAGRVLVDGKHVDEPYIEAATYLQPMPDYDWTLGEGVYCVLGDARDDSLDSRRWGPVPRAEIVGVLTRRFWPLTRFGAFRGSLSP